MSHESKFSKQLINLPIDFCFGVGLSENCLLLTKCHRNQDFLETQ